MGILSNSRNCDHKRIRMVSYIFCFECDPLFFFCGRLAYNRARSVSVCSSSFHYLTHPCVFDCVRVYFVNICGWLFFVVVCLFVYAEALLFRSSTQSLYNWLCLSLFFWIDLCAKILSFSPPVLVYPKSVSCATSGLRESHLYRCRVHNKNQRFNTRFTDITCLDFFYYLVELAECYFSTVFYYMAAFNFNGPFLLFVLSRL